MKKTTNLNVKFLGVIPQYGRGKQKLSPQQLAALSGLLTFKGDSVEKLIREARRKKQNINKKTRLILNKSALRGHASMATMPVFCFSFEGSKMIGSMLTGITFSSALMHSGRRAGVTSKDNVYPKSILGNKKALAVYQKASLGNIGAFNELLRLGVIKDEAGKILHYGTYGTGIITLPVESLVTFLHEWELEREWMPEEAGFLLEELGGKMKSLGVDLLYATRSVAPSNTYAFPNLFKDPKTDNLVRDLMGEGKLKEREEVKVIAVESNLGRNFKSRVAELVKKQKEIFKDGKRLKKEWTDFLRLRRKLVRDYGVGLKVETLSKVSWRVWRDKKRHRTAPVITESIYYCLEQAGKVFQKYRKQFEKQGDLGEKETLAINSVLAVPPGLRGNEKARRLYLKCAFDSMKAYKDLLALGIKERDAVLVIPRAIRIGMIQEYNLHNIISGFYSLRSCVTADEQIFRQTKEEIRQLKKILKGRGLGFLNELIEPKCVTMGFCPEEESCGHIKGFVAGYDGKLHQEMKDDLEKRFRKRLKTIS